MALDKAKARKARVSKIEGLQELPRAMPLFQRYYEMAEGEPEKLKQQLCERLQELEDKKCSLEERKTVQGFIDQLQTANFP